MPPTVRGDFAEICDRRSQGERAGEFTGPLVAEHEPPRDVVLPPFRLILAAAAHPARLESPMAFPKLQRKGMSTGMSWAMNFNMPAAWFRGFCWTGYWRRSFLSGSMVAWISSAGTVPETLVAAAEGGNRRGQGGLRRTWAGLGGRTLSPPR